MFILFDILFCCFLCGSRQGQWRGQGQGQGQGVATVGPSAVALWHCGLVAAVVVVCICKAINNNWP